MCASVTVLSFQLLCVLEDFCNKQLKKYIAWKDNRWRWPDPLTIGVAMGGSSAVWEGKAVKLPRLKGAPGRWESASRDCPIWAHVSTVSGQGQAATWELSPKFSHWLPALMSPSAALIVLKRRHPTNSRLYGATPGPALTGPAHVSAFFLAQEIYLVRKILFAMAQDTHKPHQRQDGNLNRSYPPLPVLE